MSIFSSKKKEKEDFLRAHNASCHVALPHVAGLPATEGTVFDIFLHPDILEIRSNGATFNLLRSKITDVCLKTDVDIQKQYVSSVGGAVAGGMIFGAVGAAIGGKAKEKTIKSVMSYLIITYQKNDAVDYIAFEFNVRELSLSMVKDCDRLVNELQAETKNRNVSIDL